MSGEEAKRTLEAVGGLLIFIKAACLRENDSEQLEKLFDDYNTAVEVAKDAIDIMDDKLSIEDKGDKGD